MGQPNPQHNPTDGLGTPVAITLTNASGSMTKVGSQVALSPGNRIGGHQYAVTLSLAGIVANSIATLVPVVVDAIGLTYTPNTYTSGPIGAPKVPAPWLNKVKFRVYESPANGSASAIVYVVNQSQGPNAHNWGEVDALAVGQCIVEAYFPASDGPTTVQNVVNSVNTSVLSDAGVASDSDFIYAQVIVTVEP